MLELLEGAGSGLWSILGDDRDRHTARANVHGKRPTGIGAQRLGEGGSAMSPLFERFVVSASEGREAVCRALVICVPCQPQVPES